MSFWFVRRSRSIAHRLKNSTTFSLQDDPTVNLKISDQKDDGESWLKKRNAKAFYQPIVAPTVRQGTMALLQVSNH